MNGAQDTNDLKASVSRSDANVHCAIAKGSVTLTTRLSTIKAVSSEVAPWAKSKIRDETSEGFVDGNYKSCAGPINIGCSSSLYAC